MIANELIASCMAENFDKHERCVMAQVVSVEGSAYRREGSKMLIWPSGQYEGMISGGCLEADVVEESKKVMETNRSLVKKYVLDEDLVWGLGLGCPGTVTILLEPIEPHSGYWRQWVDLVQQSTPFISCKKLPANGEEVTSFVVSGEEVIGIYSQEEPWAIKALQMAKKKLKERNPSCETRTINSMNDELPIFFDVHIPPPHICIFGAGHDAIPVAQLSHQLGFRTTIIDGRPAFNTKERFPHAKRVINHPKYYESIQDITPNSYVIVMNHHLDRDIETLKYVLKSNVQYVGVLGPRKRRDKMLAILEEANVTFSNTDLEKMHSPVGLDIGAVTPEEIALSILAEIVAIQKGHTGASLKDSLYIHHHPILEVQR
jgi:xanthine dehydrogenase accessory factor